MTSSNLVAQFPTRQHDHTVCVTRALRKAEAYCQQEGLRLTELRRQVLELVWNSHRPVGAYTLLGQIGQTGRKAAPPTIYRVLEFLLEHHLIHRIASLNAYVGCNHPSPTHDAQFFICNQCGEAAELADPKIDNALARDAKFLGFLIEKQTIEVIGICDECMQRRKK